MVRNLYKDTVYGPIPADWRLMPAGAFIHDFRGGAPFRPSDFTRDGFLVLPKGGVTRGGTLRIEVRDQQYCSTDYAARYWKNQVDNSFTIIVLRDLVPSGPSIGLMVRIGEDKKYVLAQGVYGFKTSSEVLPDYLIQFSNSRPYRKAVNEIMVGSTQVHITNAAFKDMVFPIPPLSEQEVIAEALGDVDALLVGLERLIAKKRAVKTAVMQELLTGRRRLPGFDTGAGMKQTEIGEISADWRLATFGDAIVECFSGATPYRGRPEFYKGQIPWITSSELNYNTIDDTIEKITSEAARLTNLRMVPKGTFLMAITGLEAAGTRGSCAITGIEATTNQSCMAIIPNSKLLTEYLFHYYVFKGEELAFKYCQGTKQQSYTAGLVKLLPIALPTVHEQQAIATVLTDIDAEITALHARHTKTQAIKQGMMQELLTGRTRLV